MKSLEELGAIDRVNRLGEFARFARLLAVSKGLPANVLPMARAQGASPRVLEALEKAAVNAGGAGTAGSWGDQTVGTRLVLGAFSDSLKQSSAFARLVADGAIVRLPLEPSVVGLVAISSANAALLAPGAAIPVRRLDAYQRSLTRQKAAACVVLTNEFLQQSPAEAESIITRSLRSAVGAAIDAQFVTTITTGVVARTSQGLLVDVRQALDDVDPTPDSRLAWIASPDVGILLATDNTSGVRHFPDALALGGTVVGIPVLVSSGVASGTLILVDAARIAGGLEEAQVSISTQGSLQLDDDPSMSAGEGSPTSPVETTVVSLWQTNATAIAAVQAFGVAVLRPGAVASVFVGGSP